MKMVKSLLLGGAAGLVALTGAQAADLPVKAAPVQYVKVCSLYGAGFYYMPGTDTCLKIGGYVRAEMNFLAGGSYNPYRATNFDSPGTDFETTRVRFGISADARTQTAFGTLRSYMFFAPTATNGNQVGGGPYNPVFAPAGFIQLAGFTAGLTGSFFDFDTQSYSNLTPYWSSNQGGNGIPVFAYTAQFGNGWSATISAEDTTSRRSAITGAAGAVDTYGGREWPDVVANLRVDQAWGSAQIMGAIHDVHAYVPGSTIEQHSTGYAAGAGLKLNAPMFGKGDYFLGQVTFAKGATNYLLVNTNGGGIGYGAFALSTGYPVVTNTAFGPTFDAVGVNAGGDLDLSSGWDVTAGFEHHWVPNWKTSIYGSYGELHYSDAASAVMYAANGVAGGNTSGNWSAYQVGSRTVWTVVPNLDLSLEITYNKVNTAFDGGTAAAYGTFDDKGFVSGMFRVQRNFYP